MDTKNKFCYEYPHPEGTDKKERPCPRDLVRGCIFGGAVGDALGYPVEFMSYREICHSYGRRGITRYLLDGNGRALISDDTQMSLFTATGLLFASTRGLTHGVCGAPESYVAGHYLDWYATQVGGASVGYGGSWLSGEGRMKARRAPGSTCLSALEAIRNNRTVENDSKGCGGVMRVAPVAVFNDYRPDEGRRATLAARLAAITHRHPLGFMSAAALVMIISRIIGEHCPAETGMLSGLVRRVAGDIGEVRLDYDGNSGTYASEYPRECEELSAILRRAADLARSDRSDVECIHALGGGWTGDEALAIAVFCVLRHPDSFEEAVIAAVNHDGDSDSTGAVCGNIMGVIVGEKGIPAHLLEPLEIRDLIDEVAEDVYVGCRISEYGPIEDISEKEAREWEQKYIHCLPSCGTYQGQDEDHPEDSAAAWARYACAGGPGVRRIPQSSAPCGTDVP